MYVYVLESHIVYAIDTSAMVFPLPTDSKQFKFPSFVCFYFKYNPDLCIQIPHSQLHYFLWLIYTYILI